MPVPDPIDCRRGSLNSAPSLLHGERCPKRPIRRGDGGQGSCSLIGGRSQGGFGPRFIDTSMEDIEETGEIAKEEAKVSIRGGWTKERRRRRNRRREWRDDGGRSSRHVGVVAASDGTRTSEEGWNWWKGRKHSQESDVRRAGVPTWRWTKVVSRTAWLVGCKCTPTPKKWWKRKKT